MKNRFYVYASWEEQMSLLSTEEQATMLMNLFRYQKGEELVLNTPMLKMCWASMTFLLEKDNQAYRDSVERGKHAAAKKKQNQQTEPAPHDTATAPNDTNTALNGTARHRIDNDNDNVNDNVDVNENGNDIQSVNVRTSTNVYPSPNSTEFELLTKEERTKAMDLYFSL
jgi:hypothetical protein